MEWGRKDTDSKQAWEDVTVKLYSLTTASLDPVRQQRIVKDVLEGSSTVSLTTHGSIYTSGMFLPGKNRYFGKGL